MRLLLWRGSVAVDSYGAVRIVVVRPWRVTFYHIFALLQVLACFEH